MPTACPSCGARTIADHRFCARCGTALGGGPAAVSGRFCTRCGGPLSATAVFCARCGAEAETEGAQHGRRPGDGNGFVDEDEDLLAEWEDALRPPSAGPRPAAADPAITETIPRPPAAPPEPVIAHPEPAPERHTPAFAVHETSVMPVPRISRTARVAEPRSPFRFPLGATLALLGSVAVILSAVLPWEGTFGPALPRDIGAGRLLDPNAVGGISLGVVLLAAGTTGALVALLTMAVPLLKPLRRVIGLLTLAIPLAFALRTAQALLGDAGISTLWSELGAGVYVAAGGAFIELVSGRWFRR